MEVTRDNFDTAYELLEEELNKADFVAIDTEFTGLSTIKHGGQNCDTFEELYKQKRLGSSQMLLIQYGVCLFTWNDDHHSYDALPFTFYIFPQPYKGFGNDIMFTSQSSSINFLAEHGFDFNKLFYKGISFMSSHEEEIARKKFEKDMESFNSSIRFRSRNIDIGKLSTNRQQLDVSIPDKEKEFINTIFDSIDSLMNDPNRERIDLPACSPLQCKLVREIAKEVYPSELSLEDITLQNDTTFIRVEKTSKTLRKLQQERRNNEERILREALDFTNVIKLLIESQKPLIGHNMCLDLFLSYTNFFGLPPLCSQEFTNQLTDKFPIKFDTKVLATSPPLNRICHSSTIRSLVQKIKNKQLPDPKVFLNCKLKSEVNAKELKAKADFHQAGYDAYCTGMIFISFVKYITFIAMTSKSCTVMNSHCDNVMTSELIDRIQLSGEHVGSYTNRMYLMGMRGVSSYVDLCHRESKLMHCVRCSASCFVKSYRSLILTVIMFLFLCVFMYNYLGVLSSSFCIYDNLVF